MKVNDNYDFTRWVKFCDYKRIEGSSFPGVYILAHFGGITPDHVNSSCSEICYTGETTSQLLRNRVDPFSGSAFHRKNGHSGGWSYSRHFLEEKK